MRAILLWLGKTSKHPLYASPDSSPIVSSAALHSLANTIIPRECSRDLAKASKSAVLVCEGTGFRPSLPAEQPPWSSRSSRWGASAWAPGVRALHGRLGASTSCVHCLPLLVPGLPTSERESTSPALRPCPSVTILSVHYLSSPAHFLPPGCVAFLWKRPEETVRM